MKGDFDEQELERPRYVSATHPNSTWVNVFAGLLIGAQPRQQFGAYSAVLPPLIGVFRVVIAPKAAIRHVFSGSLLQQLLFGRSDWFEFGNQSSQFAGLCLRIGVHGFSSGETV